MIVNNPTNVPFSNVDRLGVAICQTKPGWYHIGILYKAEGADPKICHMAWHHALMCGDPVDPKYDWMQSGIDETNKNVIVAAMVGMEVTRRLPVPYSTYFEGTYFVPNTLIYSRKEPGAGLTCATFIIAAFASLGCPLIAEGTWQSRPTDQAWKNEIIAIMREQLGALGLSEEHIIAQEARVGDPRFQPEEVAAAIANDNRPITFDQAVQLGAEILPQVRSAETSEPAPSADLSAS